MLRTNRRTPPMASNVNKIGLFEALATDVLATRTVLLIDGDYAFRDGVHCLSELRQLIQRRPLLETIVVAWSRHTKVCADFMLTPVPHDMFVPSALAHPRVFIIWDDSNLTPAHVCRVDKESANVTTFDAGRDQDGVADFGGVEWSRVASYTMLASEKLNAYAQLLAQRAHVQDTHEGLHVEWILSEHECSQAYATTTLLLNASDTCTSWINTTMAPPVMDRLNNLPTHAPYLQRDKRHAERSRYLVNAVVEIDEWHKILNVAARGGVSETSWPQRHVTTLTMLLRVSTRFRDYTPRRNDIYKINALYTNVGDAWLQFEAAAASSTSEKERVDALTSTAVVGAHEFYQSALLHVAITDFQRWFGTLSIDGPSLYELKEACLNQTGIDQPSWLETSLTEPPVDEFEPFLRRLARVHKSSIIFTTTLVVDKALSARRGTVETRVSPMESYAKTWRKHPLERGHTLTDCIALMFEQLQTGDAATTNDHSTIDAYYLACLQAFYEREPLLLSVEKFYSVLVKARTNIETMRSSAMHASKAWWYQKMLTRIQTDSSLARRFRESRYARLVFNFVSDQGYDDSTPVATRRAYVRSQQQRAFFTTCKQFAVWSVVSQQAHLLYAELRFHPRHTTLSQGTFGIVTSMQLAYPHRYSQMLFADQTIEPRDYQEMFEAATDADSGYEVVMREHARDAAAVITDEPLRFQTVKKPQATTTLAQYVKAAHADEFRSRHRKDPLWATDANRDAESAWIMFVFEAAQRTMPLAESDDAHWNVKTARVLIRLFDYMFPTLYVHVADDAASDDGGDIELDANATMAFRNTLMKFTALTWGRKTRWTLEALSIIYEAVLTFRQDVIYLFNDLTARQKEWKVASVRAEGVVDAALHAPTLERRASALAFWILSQRLTIPTASRTVQTWRVRLPIMSSEIALPSHAFKFEALVSPIEGDEVIDHEYEYDSLDSGDTSVELRAAEHAGTTLAGDVLAALEWQSRTGERLVFSNDNQFYVETVDATPYEERRSVVEHAELLFTLYSRMCMVVDRADLFRLRSVNNPVNEPLARTYYMTALEKLDAAATGAMDIEQSTIQMATITQFPHREFLLAQYDGDDGSSGVEPLEHFKQVVRFSKSYDVERAVRQLPDVPADERAGTFFHRGRLHVRPTLSVDEAFKLLRRDFSYVEVPDYQLMTADAPLVRGVHFCTLEGDPQLAFVEVPPNWNAARARIFWSIIKPLLLRDAYPPESERLFLQSHFEDALALALPTTSTLVTNTGNATTPQSLWINRLRVMYFHWDLDTFVAGALAELDRLMGALFSIQHLPQLPYGAEAPTLDRLNSARRSVWLSFFAVEQDFGDVDASGGGWALLQRVITSAWREDLDRSRPSTFERSSFFTNGVLDDAFSSRLALVLYHTLENHRQFYDVNRRQMLPNEEDASSLARVTAIVRDIQHIHDAIVRGLDTTTHVLRRVLRAPFDTVSLTSSTSTSTSDLPTISAPQPTVQRVARALSMVSPIVPRAQVTQSLPPFPDVDADATPAVPAFTLRSPTIESRLPPSLVLPLGLDGLLQRLAERPIFFEMYESRTLEGDGANRVYSPKVLDLITSNSVFYAQVLASNSMAVYNRKIALFLNDPRARYEAAKFAVQLLTN